MVFHVDDCPRFGWASVEGDNNYNIPISEVVSSYENYRVRNGMN